MTAEIIQIRDYQSKKDIERMQRDLEKEAAAIMSQLEPIPYAGNGIDGMWPNFSAPAKDPA